MSARHRAAIHAVVLLATLAAAGCRRTSPGAADATPGPGTAPPAPAGDAAPPTGADAAEPPVAEDASADAAGSATPPADRPADAAFETPRPGTRPALLWRHDPDGYLSEAGFLRASLFSAELVVIAHDPLGTGARFQTVTALDPADGKTLWTAEGVEHVVHHPGRSTPLYLASGCWPDDEETVDCSSRRPVRELREVEPRTGEVVRRIPIDPVDGYDTTFHLAPNRILCIRGGGLIAIDSASGATAWTVPRGAGTVSRPPVVLADRVVVAGDGCVAYALGDGTKLFDVPGCFDPIASPDGAHLLGTRYGALESIEIGPQGETIASYPNKVVAVSDRYAVFQELHGPPDRPGSFEVYEHGGEKPVFTLQGTARNEYHSAVAVYGGELFYFSGRDNTLWRQDVASGRRQRIRRFSAGFSIAPDGVGGTPAHLSDPPLHAPPYLFVSSWDVAAYRLAPME